MIAPSTLAFPGQPTQKHNGNKVGIFFLIQYFCSFTFNPDFWQFNLNRWQLSGRRKSGAIVRFVGGLCHSTHVTA
jgi:hypothetical protein